MDLVGYASFTLRAANVAFPGALGVNQLEVFSAAPQYYLQLPLLTTNLEPRKGVLGVRDDERVVDGHELVGLMKLRFRGADHGEWR